MNIKLADILNIDQWDYWLNQYAGFGPLPGILLTMLESVFPVLPLFAIVAGNAAAYGLWWGLLYSWIGSTLGSIIVFSIFRTISKKRIRRFIARSPKVDRFFRWVERKGFTPIFLMYSFPFAPSTIVNITAGISNVTLKTYLFATALGKGVMVFIMSFIGHDFTDMLKNPWRLAILFGAIVLLWLGGKLVENRYVKQV